MGARWPTVILALVTLASQEAAGALAAPGDDAFVETTRFSTSSQVTHSAFARCPGGARALGGGVVPFVNPTSGFPQTFGPLDETDAMATTVDGDIARSIWTSYRNQSLGGFDVAVTAICSQNSDATIEATQFSAPMGTTVEFARCPTGKRAVGGGVVHAGGATDLVLKASAPLDTSETVADTTDGDAATVWYAGVNNGGASGVVQMKVFAVCSAGSDAIVEEKQFTITGGFGQAAQDMAICPAGRRVLGGGVVPYSVNPVIVRASAPYDETGTLPETGDGDVARSWFGSASNTTPTPQDVKVLALCASDPAPPAPPGDQTPPASDPGSSTPGGQTAPPSSSTPVDTAAPTVTLARSASQSLRRNKGIIVTATVDEAANLAATASVSVPAGARVYRFTRATKAATAGQRVRLRLKLGRRPLAAVNRALRGGRRLTAKVTLTATDAVGNSRRTTQRIRLKR